MRPVRAVAAATLVIGLSLGSAASAQARVLVHGDRTADVRSGRLDKDVPKLSAAPRHHDGDIRRIRVSNGPVVGIRVRFEELKRTASTRYDILRVVTDTRVVRTVLITTGPGSRAGRVSVTRADYTPVSCRVTHSADYAANVLVIHVPRSCLKSPRWVRAGYIAASVTRNGKLLFIDDALRDRSASFQGTPRLSKRIWRR